MRTSTHARAGFLAALAATLLLQAVPLQAETRVFGDYQVHYSVLQSSLLPPATAATYGVVRARDRALLNVVVQRVDGTPVGASVSGTRSDLVHKHPLEFRAVREEQAVYNLADFGFVNAETLYFTVAVLPEGAASGFTLEFSHTLYAD